MNIYPNNTSISWADMSWAGGLRSLFGDIPMEAVLSLCPLP